jgi:hypothetical protein
MFITLHARCCYSPCRNFYNRDLSLPAIRIGNIAAVWGVSKFSGLEEMSQVAITSGQGYIIFSARSDLVQAESRNCPIQTNI